MHTKHKTIAVTGIKTAGLADGEFIGWASTFGNIDAQGDRVMPGAFAKSIDAMASGAVVPIAWEHLTTDPRNLVGEIKSARETDEGLEIHAKLDLDSEFGAAAYRQVKARRVSALSIGYGVRQATKAADGAQELVDLDLMEVSLVSRPANDRATITASKSGTDGTRESAIVIARRAIENLTKAADDNADDEAPAYDEDALDKTHGQRLLDALATATEAAEAIVKAAEDDGRDLSREETAEVVKRLRYIDATKREIQDWADMDPAGRHGIQAQQDLIGHQKCTEAEFVDRWGTYDAPAKALMTFDATDVGIVGKKTTTTTGQEATSMNSSAPRFLTFGAGRKAAAETISKAITGRGDKAGDIHTDPLAMAGGSLGMSTGTKSLTASGQIVSDVPMSPTPIPAGRPATSLLDVLPVTTRATPTWRYLRQTVRDLNAAPVAPGAEKPTSDVTVQTIDGKAVVIAHLSNEVDKFVLADNAALSQFVATELVYGLDVALQAQILSGSGTGENLTGLLNTSGVQVTAFASNILTSVRRAITSAEAQGYQLGVLVMSPTDWETVELAAVATDAAVAFNGAPVDLQERKLWGLRVVLNGALPAKTALALDPSAVSVDVVGRQVDVEWDGSGELFSRNALRLRVEGRFGLSVYQPAAVYKVGTAA